MREEAAVPVVVGPGEGKTLSGRGGGYTLVTKVTDEQTRGAYAFQEMTVAPGFPWIPPHVHHDEDEALCVLEGECTVRIGERVRTLGAGTFALMPRASPTPSPPRGRRRPG
jgi:quercetin dioxygenase-like cupin family protein